jgi:hypothetical protein
MMAICMISRSPGSRNPRRRAASPHAPAQPIPSLTPPSHTHATDFFGTGSENAGSTIPMDIRAGYALRLDAGNSQAVAPGLNACCRFVGSLDDVVMYECIWRGTPTVSAAAIAETRPKETSVLISSQIRRAAESVTMTSTSHRRSAVRPPLPHGKAAPFAFAPKKECKVEM